MPGFLAKAQNCVSTTAKLAIMDYMMYDTITQSNDHSDAELAMGTSEGGQNVSKLGSALAAWTFGELAYSFFALEAWKHLNKKQLGVIALATAAGIGGVVNSALNFGMQDRITQNGCEAGAASNLFALSNCAMTQWANKAAKQQPVNDLTDPLVNAEAGNSSAATLR